jgi:acyl carrier protein
LKERIGLPKSGRGEHVEIQEKIRQFVVNNFYVADATSLKDEQSLLDAGIVDSTGVLEVIAFIEGEFSIKVDDAEMVPENLDSISNVTRFVTKKKQG